MEKHNYVRDSVDRRSRPFPRLNGENSRRKVQNVLALSPDLSTTQRYMHLSPAALEAAIRLLDGGAAAVTGGALTPATGVLAEDAGKSG